MEKEESEFLEASITGHKAVIDKVEIGKIISFKSSSTELNQGKNLRKGDLSG